MKTYIRPLLSLLFALFGAHARADVRCAALLGDERAAALTEAERVGLSVKVFSKRVGDQVKVLALVGESTSGTTLSSETGSVLRSQFDRVGVSPPRPRPPNRLAQKMRDGWLRLKLTMNRWRHRPLDSAQTELDARDLPLFAVAPTAASPASPLEDDLFDLSAGRPVGWLESLLSRFTPLHAGVAGVGAAGLAILPRLRWPALIGLSLIVSYESFGHLLAHVDPLANAHVFSALFPTLAPHPRAHVTTLLSNVNEVIRQDDIHGIATIVNRRDFERVSRTLKESGFEGLDVVPDPPTPPVELQVSSFPSELKVTEKILELARENPQHMAALASMSKILATVNDKNLELLSLELTNFVAEDEFSNRREAVARVFGNDLDASTITMLANMLPQDTRQLTAPDDTEGRLRGARTLVTDNRFRNAARELVSRMIEHPLTERRFAGALTRAGLNEVASDRLNSLRTALSKPGGSLNDDQAYDLIVLGDLIKHSQRLGSRFLFAVSRGRVEKKPVPLEAYRAGVRSKSGRKFVPESPRDYLATVLRVIVNDGLMPLNHSEFRARILASVNVELMPFKMEVNRRQPPEPCLPIPARAAPVMIDPKDFLKPQGVRSSRKRARKVEPVTEATPPEPAPRRYVIPADRDLEAIGALGVKPGETYEFYYHNKPNAPLQHVRFGPEAIAWMKEPEHEQFALKIIDGLMIGQGDRQSHGIKALRVWKSRFYDGTIFEIKIAGGWRPLVIPVNNTWEVIKVVHKDKLKMNCEHLKPIDWTPSPESR